MNTIVSDYAKAAEEIINNNTPEGFNCTINTTEVSGKCQIEN